jgi:hypothetical protein
VSSPSSSSDGCLGMLSQRRFDKAHHIAGDKPVGGKIYDTVIGERGCASPWSRSHPCRDECRKQQRRGPLRPRSIRPRYQATAARPMRVARSTPAPCQKAV